MSVTHRNRPVNTALWIKSSIYLIFVWSLAFNSQAAYLTVEQKKDLLDCYEELFSDNVTWRSWFNDLRNEPVEYKICRIHYFNKGVNLEGAYVNKGEASTPNKSTTEFVKGFDQDFITAVSHVICEDKEFLDANLPKPYQGTASDGSPLVNSQIPNGNYYCHEWDAIAENKEVPSEEDMKIMLQYASFFDVMKAFLTENKVWFIDNL